MRPGLEENIQAERDMTELKKTVPAAVGQTTDTVGQKEPWPEIVPFEVEIKTEEFFLPALPKPIADFCGALCKSLQVPTGMAGPLALGCLSTIFQSDIRFRQSPGGWSR